MTAWLAPGERITTWSTLIWWGNRLGSSHRGNLPSGTSAAVVAVVPLPALGADVHPDDDAHLRSSARPRGGDDELLATRLADVAVLSEGCVGLRWLRITPSDVKIDRGGADGA
jgi:hypothetical protein